MTNSPRKRIELEQKRSPQFIDETTEPPDVILSEDVDLLDSRNSLNRKEKFTQIQENESINKRLESMLQEAKLHKGKKKKESKKELAQLPKEGNKTKPSHSIP